MTHPLSGVEAKIGRAKGHLADFEKRFSAALDSNQQEFRLEPDNEPGWYVLRVYGVPEVDPEWSLVVGDCIHNIRAALDHLMHQLVLIDNQQPGNRTQFPIRRLPPTDKNGQRIAVPTQPAIQRRDLLDVLEEVQPYNAVKTFHGPTAVPQQDWLWIIHTLDIIDKHRLILVAVVTPDISDLSWGSHSSLAGKTFGLFGQALKDGSPIARFPFDGQPPDDFDPHPALHVALNEVETPALALWHLPWALGNMIDYVDRFIVGTTGVVEEGFRRFFP